MKDNYVELKSLSKVFGRGGVIVTAVDGIDLQVREGELVTLLGPSGCGKTTTLRMIAGFEMPSAGEILIDGERVNDVPANRRPTTMVFQNYALFPHMTVAQNITYGLRIHRVPAAEIKRRLEEVMRLVGLTGMGERSPAQLSGGQQQRVSLARSLVMEPKVLLLDEPLSNLDAKLRVSTRGEIRQLQQRIGITSVYVTHDQEEAMTLSDRVVVMHQGRIQQIGTPREIYAHPQSRFVADFIGKANFLEGTISRLSGPAEAELDILGNRVRAPLSRARFAEGQRILLVIRPESVELAPKRPGTLHGTVRESVYLGSEVVYEVEVDHQLLTVKATDPQQQVLLRNGEEASLVFKEQSLHVLPWEPSAE